MNSNRVSDKLLAELDEARHAPSFDAARGPFANFFKDPNAVLDTLLAERAYANAMVKCRRDDRASRDRFEQECAQLRDDVDHFREQNMRLRAELDRGGAE